MVNRMKHLLPRLIDDFQNAFIPGRHMDDNILITHELTHFINKQRRQKQELAALKLDMNKAYDRVRWSFLLKVLTAYGFPAYWIQLIKECITTVSYRILINGVATPPFLPTCGLQQGYPSSPYLFLFCMDILSRMTTLATDIRQFQGIRLHNQAPYISHLFFADDAMFFFKASSDSCRAVSTIINRFCDTSGQIVNLHKSFVKFSPNIPSELQQEYKQILRMPSVSSLGTYLGTLIDIQGSKVQHFTPLLDKVITTTINRWNHMNLSQATKIIIINAILLGKVLHYLSVFKIPATITNKVDSLLAMFFWKDSMGKVSTRKSVLSCNGHKNLEALEFEMQQL